MTAEFPGADDLVLHPDEILPGTVVRVEHIRTAALAGNMNFRNQRTYWSSTGRVWLPAYDAIVGADPLNIFLGHCNYDPDTELTIRHVIGVTPGSGATVSVSVTISHSGGILETETVTGITTAQYLTIDVTDLQPGIIYWIVQAWNTAGATESYIERAVAFDYPWQISAGDPDPVLPAPGPDPYRDLLAAAYTDDGGSAYIPL